MSARSCSLARRVFFKRDPLALEEPPHRPVARRRAALGQLGPHRPQRQIRLLGNPRQQPLALALQPQLPPSSHLLGRRAAGRTPALRQLHGTGHTHPKQRRRRRQVRPLATELTTRSRYLANRVLPSDAGPPAPANILNRET